MTHKVEMWCVYQRTDDGPRLVEQRKDYHEAVKIAIHMEDAFLTKETTEVETKICPN